MAKRESTRAAEITDQEKQKQGFIGTSAGLTFNLGNYQTVRCDCWLTLPSNVADAEATFEKCVDFVNEKLMEEGQKIYAENESLKGEVKI